MECITVTMKFDLPSVPITIPQSPRTGDYEYVWHCHILEYEEHDMMRPLILSPGRPHRPQPNPASPPRELTSILTGCAFCLP